MFPARSVKVGGGVERNEHARRGPSERNNHVLRRRLKRNEQQKYTLPFGGSRCRAIQDNCSKATMEQRVEFEKFQRQQSRSRSPRSMAD
eukprot:7921117-Pyramimonas_sp.AAC.1